ncbi:alpha/beta hydrolase [Nocardia stercoris]|uniref:Esterase family protein n=1 Tax=Nocardia stercoris TaxID=2483361 RepID=A0A3M2L8T2_9NOCA|nr:alpha/beta hydrolase family protein [Nocardia stercoris]RMI34072.1 esterase family protein [Nocardia stercoris]
MKRRVTSLAVAGMVSACVATTAGLGTAAADAGSDPIIASNALLASPVSDDGSKIVSGTINGQSIVLSVYSAAMDKNITVNVQRPADASVPRPVLYLLNGAGGGEDIATWQHNTNIYDMLAQKNANIVMPLGGRWAYYTDWQQDDPTLGRNKWETFLLDELPPLVNAALGTNGVQAIAANSMTATSVLNLAEMRPGFYSAVAGYSGCAQTSDPTGKQFVKMVTEAYGGGKVSNMWGPDGDPDWIAHDPVVNAEKLRGTNLFISSGSGLPGPHDALGDPTMMNPTSAGLANQIIVGGIIEAATSYCTHNLQNKLAQLGIPATFDLPVTGTHSWGYWQDSFDASWPQLAAGMGIDQ